MFKFVMGPQVRRASGTRGRPLIKAPVQSLTATGYYADAVKGVVVAGVTQIMNEVGPFMTELGNTIDDAYEAGQDTSALESEEQRLNNYLGELSRFLF
jgi:hypothetical protein